jgi:hypothetical protein
MWSWHELDDQPPILDPLDGLIARVHPKLLADGLLDRDLTALTDASGHPTWPLLFILDATEYGFHGIRTSSIIDGLAEARGLPVADVRARALPVFLELFELGFLTLQT